MADADGERYRPPGFFEAAAGVLAVFLLVMAVGEARLKGTSMRPNVLRGSVSGMLVGNFFAIALVIVGQVAAFRALIDGDSANLRTLTAGGIGFGLTYITIKLMVAILSDYGSPPEVFTRQLRLVLVLGIAVGVSTTFLLS